MFEHVELFQRFAGVCYLRSPRHDLSIERLAKRLGGCAGLVYLFPLRYELRRTRHNAPLLAGRHPTPRGALLNPPIRWILVACWSSCGATCPCAVNEAVRESPCPHPEASAATTSGLTLARRSATHTGKDKTARRTSSTRVSGISLRRARNISGRIHFRNLAGIVGSFRRNWKARTQRPPTICACTMVRGSSWQNHDDKAMSLLATARGREMRPGVPAVRAPRTSISSSLKPSSPNCPGIPQLV